MNMMQRIFMTVLLIMIIIYISITLIKLVTNIGKFNNMENDVKNKLLILDYYMVAVNNLSKEELIKLSALQKEELEKINKIIEYNERVKAMKEKIKMI
jgi:hypothetical protein